MQRSITSAMQRCVISAMRRFIVSAFPLFGALALLELSTYAL